MFGGSWVWFRRWLARFIDAPAAPVVPPPLVPMPMALTWKPSDRMAWRAFLGSPAGIGLWHRMLCVARDNARAGSQDAMNATHSAGRSAGFYDAIEWLESQARIQAEEPISGADADQSATSAHEPGEAQLREHYSP